MSNGERRQHTCEMYEVIHRIEDKVDKIAERQVIYIGKTEKLEGIVTNGLRSTVNEIKDKLEKFCDGHEKRLIKLEGFAWFREWVSDLRNNLFKYVVLLAITGGIIYVIITHGHDILEKIFK